MTSDDNALHADGADVGARLSDEQGRPVRIRFSVPVGKGRPDRIVTIAMSAAEAAGLAVLLSSTAREVLVQADPTFQGTAWINLDVKFDVTDERALITWALERHARVRAADSIEVDPGEQAALIQHEREQILNPVHGAGEALCVYFDDMSRLLTDLPPGVELAAWDAQAMTPEPNKRDW